MKIILVDPSQKFFEQNDYRGIFNIIVDGKQFMQFSDGEPEDANLGRDFNDIFKIGDLIKRVYNSGKNGETLEIESKTVDNWDEAEELYEDIS